MELRDLLSTVWKRRYLVALLVIACGGLGAVFALTREPTYESRVTIAITPDIQSQGFVPAENLSALLGTYAETVESEAVLDDAEFELGRPLDSSISSSTQEGTGILRIFARSGSAGKAQETADAVSEVFVERLAGDEFLVAQVVDSASRPDEPVQPRPPLIIGTSIVVGIGAAVLMALLLERFRRRIETPADLAATTQFPLIGQIPRSRALARSQPRIVWNEAKWVDLQESFRSVRTNLSFVAGDWPQAIQVTSASDGQGKSTIVANLAVAFSQLGLRTAVLDADLRRPVQHTIFDVRNTPGVWTGASTLDAEPELTKDSDLVVYPAGPPLRDPSSALHTRFPAVIRQLRERFDLVLVDSAPLLPIADARLIAPWVDGLVMVVAAGNEKTAQLRRAVNEVRITDVELKGLVLNQSTTVAEGGYYRRPDDLIGTGGHEPTGGRAPAEATAAEQR